MRFYLFFWGQLFYLAKRPWFVSTHSIVFIFTFLIIFWLKVFHETKHHKLIVKMLKKCKNAQEHLLFIWYLDWTHVVTFRFIIRSTIQLLHLINWIWFDLTFNQMYKKHNTNRIEKVKVSHRVWTAYKRTTRIEYNLFSIIKI